MTRLKRALPVRTLGSAASGQGALLVAGCRSDQTSADAWIDGDYHGALTYAFSKVVTDARYQITYADLLVRARALLKSGHYEQVPQLEGPRKLFKKPLFGPFRAS
jgi:hypothetical protein